MRFQYQWEHKAKRTSYIGESGPDSAIQRNRMSETLYREVIVVESGIAIACHEVMMHRSIDR